ncbi:hypothetical protein BGW42_004036 [Actinomortierella wolfii]|nr:hypothetical protein BGW42_004036 [Actinomortierella wolfii]
MRSPHLLLPTLLSALFANIKFIAAEPSDYDAFGGTRPNSQCRCLPDLPCWPSTSVWSSFNETVGGRLIATYPVARECHDPFYDEAKCSEIKQGYFYDRWRQLQPGAVQYTSWETLKGQGCLGTNQTQPCHQGNVPLYTVNVSTVADVQATVRFAAKHNIRLVVKNTGHDYLGRSTGASSITLWTYFKKKVEVTDKFVPEGAPQDTKPADAIVLESGVLWEDAYKAVYEHGRIVVGGADPTVGTSGGYCLSGGHSSLSPRHGLCVDNVLQYKVVTADGKLRVANTYQNQDLFWALRGGGPGFGVVVEAVYRTHPPVKSVSYATALIYSQEADKMNTVVREFYAHQDRWSKEGWSGYGFVTRQYMFMNYYFHDADVETSKKSLQPFLDYVRGLPNVTIHNETVINYPSTYDLFKTLQINATKENAGASGVLGSRLIPASMFQSKKGVDLLASTMRKAMHDLWKINPDLGYITHLVAGGQVAKGNSRDTSVLPAWRKALIHIVLVGGWEDNTTYAQQLEAQRILTQATDHLRRITPGMGAYQNEADPNEPNFQQNFFGSNYSRLKSIKKKYDPRSLFVCRRCVGSENWSSDELCPRRR